MASQVSVCWVHFSTEEGVMHSQDQGLGFAACKTAVNHPGKSSMLPNAGQ